MQLTKSNELIGRKFGSLTVIEESERVGKNKRALCLCDCGKHSTVIIYNLKNGHTRSCGCLRVRVATESNTSHGLSKTRFYQCWRDMIDRTTREKNSSYESYGGRGIKVCEQWEMFESFASDMYENYLEHSETNGELNTTLDRINNDKGYNKDNCRWATVKIQSSNKRSNKRFLVKGQLLTVKEISDKFDLEYAAVRKRVSLGWNSDDLISPSRKRGVHVGINA